MILGCGRSTLSDISNITPMSNKGGIKGYALLKGQTDHTGILIDIEGTGFSTVTDKYGYYKIEDVPTSTVTINYSLPGYQTVTTTNVISIGITNNISNIYLIPISNNYNSSISTNSTFIYNGSIRGTAKLNGVPTSGITVSLDGTSLSTITSPDGSYSFLNITSGNYLITYGYPGYISQSLQIPVVNEAITNAPSTDLFPCGNGIITGTILLEGKTNFSDINVSISGTSYSSITNYNGTFTISNVPSGTYTLTISKPGFVTSNVSDIYVIENQPTIISTTTLPIYYYDLSSLLLSGSVMSIAYLSGQLYISCGNKLYSVPVNNPVSTTANSCIITGNYYSIIASPTQDIISCYSDEDFDTLIDHIYKYDINLNIIETDNLTAPIDISEIYLESQTDNNILAYNFPTLNYNSEIKSNNIESCISFDGTYMWFIDSNYRLFRIRDG